MVGTDLAVRKDGTVEVKTAAELRALILEGVQADLDEDPVELQKKMLDAIFAADSVEAMDVTSGATPWQELLDVPIEVQKVSIRKSRFTEGSAVFAVVEGYRLDEGEPVTLTTSGMTVLGKLIVARERGWLPTKFKLIRQAETARGFKPLDLVSAHSDRRSV